MNHAHTTALALAAAALLAGCGGGDSDLSADAQASSRGQRQQALAAAPTITNAQLCQWAQLQYPELFGTAAPAVIPNLAFEGKVFDVRDFHNGNYLGVAEGRAYGYGNFTNFALVDFGAMQGYADTVCARVNCTGGSPVGTLNSCMEGASTALQNGRRYHTVYVSSTFVAPTSSGEYETDSEVQGSALFEGQTAIKVHTTIKGRQYGQAVDSEITNFEQIADGDLMRQIGAEATMSYAGVSALSRTVWTPPSLNTEFTLAQGQSLTKTETLSASMVVPGLPSQLPPTVSTTTSTYTFEQIETIDVLGRSYNTCRYRRTVAGVPGWSTTWHIQGRGIPARQEEHDADGTLRHRAELKSATVNGSPI